MKTLIGIVTFGNLEFTRLTINSIRETTKAPLEFFVVVGKPGDEETQLWLYNQGITALRHSHNLGFPASLNDIYDMAWRHGEFDNLIIAGNDIVPYPGAIDALIEQANTTDFEWVAASMFDVQSLVNYYPEQAKYFEGPTFTFRDFAARPWSIHEPVVAATSPSVETNPAGPSLIKDVRNLCLFKRSVFQKLGYADVNFWPGGYFEDNDYARRAVNAGIKSCALTQSQYFHFWSRTIHQETALTQDAPTSALGYGAARRDLCFQRNDAFYRTKWGGPFGSEQYAIPFGPAAAGFALTPAITLEGALKIADRSQEPAIIEFWSSLR